MCRLLPFPFLLFLIVCSANAQIAPGGPGADAEWPTAAKQGIGTANSAKSKVWFTLAQGVMTEVYYPDVATANVQMLQFVVVDPKTRTVETERDDAISASRYALMMLRFAIVKPNDKTWKFSPRKVA